MGLTRTNSNLSPHSRNPVSRGGAQSHTQGSALLRLADCQGHGLPGRHEGGSWLVKIGSRVADSHHFNADQDPAYCQSDANVRPHFEPRGILQKNFKTKISGMLGGKP
jgi:hypothetical protein